MGLFGLSPPRYPEKKKGVFHTFGLNMVNEGKRKIHIFICICIHFLHVYSVRT